MKNEKSQTTLISVLNVLLIIEIIIELCDLFYNIFT